ncbi:hypothetical protein [Amycolatopsis sp. CA-126428]|uniref:hypothetical protein n=1 Tax=Amycolatopsis sp. CA-126428 TaxID=2073158 RepID=UPI0011B0CD07|nr:hypothetical protein [Amycolatopsis sp. CA-126428]
MAPVNTAEVPMSRPEADEALSRLRADGDAFAAALMELEDHPGRRFLEGTASEGTTLDRWTAAKAAIGVLWDRLGRYRTVVRQPRRPTTSPWPPCSCAARPPS